MLEHTCVCYSVASTKRVYNLKNMTKGKVFHLPFLIVLEPLQKRAYFVSVHGVLWQAVAPPNEAFSLGLGASENENS